jgi:CBS domain-containing protein
MKVRQIMSPGVQVAAPEDTVREVAQAMADLDVGALPVCDGQRLIGMITDRDIALRIVGRGLSSGTLVHEAMTREIEFCHVEDEVADVTDRMARLKVRRLPVVDEAHRLVGIIALGDVARSDKAKRTGETLSEISEPGRKM